MSDNVVQLFPADEEDPEDRLPVQQPPRKGQRPDRPRAEDQPASTELVGPVFTGEIVDDEDPGQLVDRTPAPDPGPVWSREVHWSPVVPGWWSDTDTRRAAAAYWRRKATHTVHFHAVRAPVYAARLAGQVPRGAGRTVVGTARWVRADDVADQLAAARADGKAAVRAVELRREQAAVRSVLLGVALVVGLALWLVAGRTGWWWDRPVLALLALLGLALAGRRRDRPLIGHAVEVQQAPRLTSDAVMEALGSIGIAKLDPAGAKGRTTVSFPAPITRDGPGWRADVDLPPGVTPAEVMARKDRLASALRRTIGSVWPEADHTAHAARLVLWVGDQDMAKSRLATWPLTRAGTVDLFRPWPFATDQRARQVPLTLFETNGLIGALPGAGKTASVRLITLAAGLDPIAEVWVYELAGKGDLSPAERFAGRYGSGLDVETIEQALWALRDARQDVERRAEAMKKLPRGLCPEGKVTRQAAERRQLRLHPLVIVLDEVQNLFSHPVHGKEAGRLAEEIIRMGRALGVILILATQRPNKDAIPTGVTALAGVRFCLRVMDQTSNDMILGTSMYQAGFRASMLRPTDKGIGWLVGASDEPQIVRAYYLDLTTADRVAERARAAREAAGTLAGYAAGEEELRHEADVSLLRDLMQVFGGDEQVHSDVLCGRLAEDWPGRYDGWQPTTLAAALKALGVKTKRNTWAERLDGSMDNRAGVVRADLQKALGESV